MDFYNSAVLVTPDGSWCEPGRREQSYYDKMHLVMFGEYMPFVKSVPWLQSLSPLCTNYSPGERPKGFMLKNVCLVPNICYETVLPQVIRNQLVTLRQARPQSADPGQRDERRLVLGLERIGAAFGLRGISHGRMPAADGHRREHGHFGLDRWRRPHPGRGAAARNED